MKYGPSNQERAEWAKAALETFASVTGMEEELQSEEEVELVVSDLLADLMHFCDEKEISFDVCVERATSHYREELNDEAEESLQ